MELNNQPKYGKKASLIYLVSPKINKLLFYLRDDKDIAERNKWSIFGGVIENGETKEEGLERELKEELNIYVGNIRYLSSFINIHNQILYFFRGEIKETKLENITITEGQKVRFFSPDEIKRKGFETSVGKYFLKNKRRIIK
ncbi:MAG: NUDIX domain-containing protein [Nanoarchaeota archaeon]